MGASAKFIDAVSRTGALDVSLKMKRSPPVILMYHGVTAARPAAGPVANCEGKHLALDIFAEHLRILRRTRRVVPLHEMVEGLARGEARDNEVALTFDDGYENNATVAAPLLADFRMPAAFFLTTGLVGTAEAIWTDKVEMAFDRTAKTTLHLRATDETLPLHTPQERRQAMLRTKAVLKRLPTPDFHHAFATILHALGDPDTAPSGDYRFMSWDQARAMSDAGFEMGAHTVTHPILSRMPFEQAAHEMLSSRDRVTQETGACSSTFCFPNGKSSDYTQELLDLCQQHFKAALSTERGPALPGELLTLRRLSPSGAGRGENIQWMLLRAR
ncbi:hypothetical protein E4K72_13080 [Oxalobacteraceae bacterium OM1]|nr:hypothetical protein E4K72_13080 [Oxalobacteraceae bacterium OM1]